MAEQQLRSRRYYTSGRVPFSTRFEPETVEGLREAVQRGLAVNRSDVVERAVQEWLERNLGKSSKISA